MQNKLYAIMDRVAGISQVYCAPTDAMAIRGIKMNIEQQLNDNERTGQKSAMLLAPEDYVLVALGTIDTDTGEIMPNYEEIFDVYEYLCQTGNKKKEKEKDERQN